MLIVSLRAEESGRIARWAANAGLAIVAAGPVDASLIVSGRSRTAIALAIDHGALVTAAPTGGCGAAG